MTDKTPDPITTQERTLVRSTVTGFEQGIAAMAGFFVAGPVGSIASWGAIRGLQGKWAPWFVLGIPTTIAINTVQILLLATVMGTFSEPPGDVNETSNTDLKEQITHIKRV